MSNVSSPEGKITFTGGVSYAVGSIMGSGILFLPALTIETAGDNALISWALVTLICIPLLYIFSELLKRYPGSESLDGIVTAVMGNRFKFVIPLLFVATVVLGMPAALLIAANYVSQSIHQANANWVPALIISLGIVANVSGLDLGVTINKTLVVGFLVLAVGLPSAFFLAPTTHFQAISLSMDIPAIISATVMTFWAFAGFENLTFITSSLKGGSRAFFKIGITALVICGFIYALLTFALIQTGGGSSIKSFGLMPLIQTLSDRSWPTILLAAFAFSAVLINHVAWTKGICMMLDRNLSELFSVCGFRKTNLGFSKIVVLFSIVLTLSVILQSLVPSGMQIAITAASTNFIVIYLVVILSYLIQEQRPILKILGSLAFLGLLGSLLSNPINLVYPSMIILISIVGGKRYAMGKPRASL